MFIATKFRGDEGYFARLATDAPATARWLQSHGIEFIQPPYYLSKGPPRIQPVGGGANLIKVLTQAAMNAGVTFRYDCSAREIVMKDNRIVGLVVEQAGTRETLPADPLVPAGGGLQGNAARMRAHLGDGGQTMRLISPGTHFNTGDGIAMATKIGADESGDWSGMHCEPVDPRSKNSAPPLLCGGGGRADAGDLGMAGAQYPFWYTGLDRVRHSRQPSARHCGLSACD